MSENKTRERRDHWGKVYDDRAPEEVSWYQAEPRRSLELIARCGIARRAPIIDVGGGASRLVDELLALGYSDVSVLDLAESALAASRARLGDDAARVTWIAADVLTWQPPRRYRLWHDRAVFHFLTEPADQRRYATILEATLEPGGFLVIATFAPEGPERCSGLPVARHSRETLSAVLGDGFAFLDQQDEIHTTPGGVAQAFLYQRYRRR